MKYLATLTLATGLAFALMMGVSMTQSSAVADESKKKEAKQGLPEAPAFTLTDSTGKVHNLADYRGKHVVLEWFNEGCPFVVKFYRPGKMQEWQKYYREKGVVWLLVCSSAPGKQGYRDADGFNELIKAWNIQGDAMLLDPDGTVGRAYDARTTPHMYIINPDGKLIYQGAIDSIRSARADDIEKADNYVAKVLDGVLLGSTRPYGCSVKY